VAILIRDKCFRAAVLCDRELNKLFGVICKQNLITVLSNLSEQVIISKEYYTRHFKIFKQLTV
jgi:hypothetical protein